MSKRMKSILGRLLREEMKNQLIWKEKGEKMGLNEDDRLDIIEEIKEFMIKEGIDLYE